MTTDVQRAGWLVTDPDGTPVAMAAGPTAADLLSITSTDGDDDGSDRSGSGE